MNRELRGLGYAVLYLVVAACSSDGSSTKKDDDTDGSSTGCVGSGICAAGGSTQSSDARGSGSGAAGGAEGRPDASVSNDASSGGDTTGLPTDGGVPSGGETAVEDVNPTGAIMAKHDAFRTGWYPEQPTLHPAIVGGKTFGRLFATPLTKSPGEQVLAQPLVVDGTVFIVTEDNDAYSLDAETGAILASVSLGLEPWHSADIGCGDIKPNVGVTGTPVIDKETKTAYFFSKGYRPGGGHTEADAIWMAHALDVKTLAERPNFPLEIKGTAANDPAVAFTPFTEMQRPGLLLLDGVVYGAFGGHCDQKTYHGFLVGIDPKGAIKTIFATEAGKDGVKGAGIWHPGGGLVSDGAGRLFFVTGNGFSKEPTAPLAGSPPPTTLGQSAVRMRVASDGTLAAEDFFTPYDAEYLDGADYDFGSGGPVALPSQYFGTPDTPRIMVSGGKEGVIYLMNRDSLGGFKMGPHQGDNVLSQVSAVNGLWSTPAIWPAEGKYVYVTTSGGPFRAYKYDLRGDGVPSLTEAGKTAQNFNYGSGSPIVTSDGTTPGSALVWVTYSTGPAGQGTLRAYDAVPDDKGALVVRFEDAYGANAKFASPGVGDGRLYMGTGDGHVMGYGSPLHTPLTGDPVDFGTVLVGKNAIKTITMTVNADTSVTKLSGSDPAFTVGTPSVPLPANLKQGDKVTVDVTFAPLEPRSYGAALDIEGSAGPSAVAMRGVGQTDGPQLSVSPPAVSFGGVGVGATRTANITLTNLGSKPLHFGGATLPKAPFAVTGAPKDGAALASGKSVAVTITFAPEDTGTAVGSLELTSDGGNVSVYLSGTSAYAGSLDIAPETVDFDATAPGQTQSLTFEIRNMGGTDITITKSKPPAMGVFVAETALDEGTVIPAGATVTETVAFRPTASGLFQDAWVLGASDGTGSKSIPFFGAAGNGSGLAATYYSHLDLTTEVVGRTDPVIDYSGGPLGDGIDPNQFSVRWTGQLEAPATGTYTFFTRSDDGIRAHLVDHILVDDWTNHGLRESQATVDLVAGQKYDLEVDYYNAGGGASAELLWSSDLIHKSVVPKVFLYPKAPPAGSGTGLTANYFNSEDLSGAPVTRLDPKIDFIWKHDPPVAGFTEDHYSTRWTGQVQAQYSEDYNFVVRSDDGVRLWVGGQLVVDDWTLHSVTEKRAIVHLSAGRKYDIKIEYFESVGDASISLLWTSPSTPLAVIPTILLYPTAGGALLGSGDGLLGNYFDAADFTGATVKRIDATVNFDWGLDPPLPGVAASTYSVRWTGQIEPQFAEQYTFYTRSDDGVRLTIDGKLVVDDFVDHGVKEDTALVVLATGKRYAIQMDYYQKEGGATAALLWSSPSTPKEVVPATQLYSLAPAIAGTGTGLTGAYFNSVDFSGQSVPRVDPTVGFDWGDGGPAPGVDGTTFSVRWTGFIQSRTSERYTIGFITVGGAKLYIGTSLGIDDVAQHDWIEDEVSVPLVAGIKYPIVVEYTKQQGQGTAQLEWSTPTIPKAIIPTQQLYPAQ
jgi:iron transport multicopper oxidase